GITSIDLTPQGAQDALLEGARGISERFLTLFSPISAFAGDKGGIGASVLLDLVNDATTAEVQPGALVHTGVPGAGDAPAGPESGLTVTATQTTFSFALAQAGTNGSALGFGGSFVGDVVTNATTAALDSGVQVTGGPVHVVADDELFRADV